MTSELKPTKGPCAVKFRKDDSCYISIGDPVNGPHKQFDMPFERSYANDEADAMLIEETFNVYTETGRTPRQLAEQRDWLLNALQHIAGSCDGRAQEVAAAALAKVEAKP